MKGNNNNILWAPIPGYPRYEVSNTGLVRGLTCRYGLRKKPRLLKLTKGTGGYLRTGLCKKSYKQDCLSIHRLVLLAFIGPCPNGKEAAHLDGNPENNHIENLQWVTHKENINHSRAHGTLTCGERIAQAKLNTELVQEIIKREGTMSHKKLGVLYGVSEACIRSVLIGKTWKHITGRSQ
jgi:hypothetical protein